MAVTPDARLGGIDLYGVEDRQNGHIKHPATGWAFVGNTRFRVGAMAIGADYLTHFGLLPRFWHILPFHPFLSLRADFFLPNGDDLFQTINAIPGGVENARIPVGGGTGDEHGRGARIEAANALNDGNPFHDRPFFADFVGDLFHFGFGHGNVGLIFEVFGLGWEAVFARFPAHHTGEDGGGAGGGQRDLIEEVIEVNDFFGDSVNGGGVDWLVGHWSSFGD